MAGPSSMSLQDWQASSSHADICKVLQTITHHWRQDASLPPRCEQQLAIVRSSVFRGFARVCA